MQKKLYFSLILYAKVDSKWTRALSIKSKSIKLLEENIGVNFHCLGLGNSFLDMASNIQVPKGNIDKLDFIKMKKKTKHICALKNTIKRAKTQLTEWRKYLQKIF